MNLVRTVTFRHEGTTYEIRVCSDGWKFTIRAFKDGKPANGYSYNVDLPTAFDLENARGCSAIDELIETAKSDISEGNWERYVEAYLASLNLKEDEGIGCQECTSRDIEIKMANERKLYRCRHCGHVWYGPRGARSGYDHELDELAEGVVKDGESETFVSFLLNCSFREERGTPSFRDQLQNWCNQNYLEYTVSDKPDAHGKMQQMIRFTRKRSLG